MYINNCNFCGRVTREIKLSEHHGVPRVQFTLGLNKSGRSQAHYLKCVAWAERAQNISQILSVGQEVYVSGELELRHFTDTKDGTDRRDVFLIIKEFSAGAVPRKPGHRPVAIRKPTPFIREEEDI